MKKQPSAKNKRRYDLNARIAAARKAAKTRQKLKAVRKEKLQERPNII
jgi:hypothetical protein